MTWTREDYALFRAEFARRTSRILPGVRARLAALRWAATAMPLTRWTGT